MEFAEESFSCAWHLMKRETKTQVSQAAKPHESLLSAIVGTMRKVFDFETVPTGSGRFGQLTEKIQAGPRRGNLRLVDATLFGISSY